MKVRLQRVRGDVAHLGPAGLAQLFVGELHSPWQEAMANVVVGVLATLAGREDKSSSPPWALRARCWTGSREAWG